MLSRAAVVRLTLANAVLAVLVTIAVPLPAPPEAPVAVPVTELGAELAADVLVDADPEGALARLAVRSDVDPDPALERLARSRDGLLAGQALCALARRSPRRAEDLIAHFLFEGRGTIPSPLVLRAAAIAPSPVSRPALENAAEDGDGLDRRLALAALARLGDLAAGARLRALADGEDPWEDLGVADALSLVDARSAEAIRSRALASLPRAAR